MTKIFETLKQLGLTSEETAEVYANHTRDNPDLKVYRDSQSGVIFIKDHYVGNAEYESGQYRKDLETITKVTDYEDCTDSERRFQKYKQFFIGKDICDFGCGAGTFLKRTYPYANYCWGVELQEDYRNKLIRGKPSIACAFDIRAIVGSFDTVFMFHTLEHLPEPIETLKEIRKKIKPGGRIVVEVPHARDFLLEIGNNDFKNFTLWSQHLILHTRESLRKFLEEAGYSNIVVEGVQRYGWANHLQWLQKGLPGGHRSSLSVVETEGLKEEYAKALGRMDMTDTLVAIAEVA